MGTFKSQDLHFVTLDGAVKRQGGSLTLAAGTVGIVNISKSPTSKGAALVDNFDILSKKDRLEIRMGRPDLGVSRSLTNKSITSPYSFSLNDIVDLRVSAPKTEGIPSVDDFIIGYNGMDNSEIVLGNGDSEQLQVTVSGKAMGYLGYPKSTITAQVNISAPNSGDFTMQEIIEKAAADFKDYQLLGSTPLGDYLDVIVVNSENVTLTPNTQFFELVVDDGGTYSDLSRIQTAYPGLIIRRKEYTVTDGSVYVAIATALPADYLKTKPNKLKGCDDCPTGYTEITGGWVYEVSLEDDGADEVATIEGLPTAVAGTGSKNAQDRGYGTYSVILDEPLTDTDLEAFITANPTAEVCQIGEVASVCEAPTDACPYVWVEGDNCTVDTETYTICLADDECGNSRLEELQNTYPELTITEVAGSEVACMRSYTTTVATNIVCEECDPIFREVFISEAPGDFDLVSWKKDAKTYSSTAKMGIRFRAKQNILSGGECLRDDINFLYDSVRLSVAGGFPTMINSSYGRCGNNDRFAVKMISRYKPAVNLGGDLRAYEDRSRMYFDGNFRHVGNNYAKFAFGEETRLQGTKGYVDYVLIIQTQRVTSMQTNLVNEKIAYHIIAPVGQHVEVENLLNDLAAAAGINQVKAYATN